MGGNRFEQAKRAGLAAALILAAAPASHAVVPAEAELAAPDLRHLAGSAEARQLARWVADTRDARGRPYAVVDKQAARIFVFAADGRLVGAAAALLGAARGDESAPGVGQRALADLRPHERTTPAGRFESEPGRNLQGEAVVWVAYDDAVAIHRLRPAPAAERRPQRLASPTPADNRITLGCIVVDEAFYDAVVAPTLGLRRGVVYVLPDDVGGEALRSAGAADAL